MRFLTSEGTPATGLRPHISRPGSERFSAIAPTWNSDEGGRCKISGSPGLIEVRVPRRGFDDWHAWTRWKRAHPGVEDARRLVLVAEVALGSGTGEEIEIVLPEEWARSPE